MPRFYAESSPTYEPAMRLVTSITNAEQATVTTSFDHDYLAGLIVRFVVPDAYGMKQLSTMTGQILTVPTTDPFTIDIDTIAFDTFINVGVPTWYLNKTAQVVPVGEINSSLAQATRNVLT